MIYLETAKILQRHPPSKQIVRRALHEATRAAGLDEGTTALGATGSGAPGCAPLVGWVDGIWGERKQVLFIWRGYRIWVLLSFWVSSDAQYSFFFGCLDFRLRFGFQHSRTFRDGLSFLNSLCLRWV